MNTHKYPTWSRREFLRGLTITSSVGLLGLQAKVLATEPPPETAKIRFVFDPKAGSLCYAPQYFAEQFLRIEGFTEISYVPYGAEGSGAKVLANNKADMTAGFGTEWVQAIDDGDPVTVLSGLHPGCLELFANEQVQSIRDLEGKRIAVRRVNTGGHIFLSAVVAYIGIDPGRDITWIESNPSEWVRLLAEGEVDAIGTFPPKSYEVRAEKVGHVILNTTTDEPWRHYFCCVIGAGRAFVNNYPIATKRALRAILKANRICSLEPESTARSLIDQKYASSNEYTLSTLRDIPYASWRSYDPEDSLRFYSLRLREAGLVKNTPQEIIAQGTDWRFINELKRELKA